jgi:hypothetical protein
MKKLNVTRESVSTRGGGVEITLDNFGYEEQRMTAYQNYLGGGMLGGIGNSCTMTDWAEDDTLVIVAKRLRQHWADLMEIDVDDFEGLSVSAY